MRVGRAAGGASRGRTDPCRPVFVGWANTVFYWFANAAGSRALTLGDNPLGASNLFGMIGFSLAFVGALVAPVLLVHAALRLLRS